MVNKRIRFLVASALFAALIAVGAFIRIPTPIAPITLQTLFVVLSGLVLGLKFGPISSLIYVFLGLVGVPVFAGGGGISYLLNPTFGYIIGFPICAATVGFLSDRYGSAGPLKCFLYSAVGMIPVYIIGASYFAAVSHFVSGVQVGFSSILLGGIVIFIPSDLVMCFIASLIATKLKKAIRL